MDKFIISYAMSLLGNFYSWGGNGPNFDCSGLLSEILRAAGLVKEGYRNSALGIYLDHARHWEELDKPQAGCVVFYADSKGVINHVAYAVSNLSIVEAAGGNEKTITEADAKRDRAFVRLRPYNYRKPFKFYLPNYPLYKEG